MAYSFLSYLEIALCVLDLILITMVHSCGFDGADPGSRSASTS